MTSAIGIPERYGYLSVVRIVVRFYVVAEAEDVRPNESSFVILYGPFESADQASMAEMLIGDRLGTTSTVAMTDESASEMRRN